MFKHPHLQLYLLTVFLMSHCTVTSALQQCVCILCSPGIYSNTPPQNTTHFCPTVFLEKHSVIAEVITESMTAAPLGRLLSLTHARWAPRLATKTVRLQRSKIESSSRRCGLITFRLCSGCRHCEEAVI